MKQKRIFKTVAKVNPYIDKSDIYYCKETKQYAVSNYWDGSLVIIEEKDINWSHYTKIK